MDGVRIAIADEALDKLLADLVALRSQRAISEAARAERASDEIDPDFQPPFEPTEKQNFLDSVGNFFKKMVNIGSSDETSQNNYLQSESTNLPTAAQQELGAGIPIKSSKTLHQLGRPKSDIYNPKMKLKARFDSEIDETFLNSTASPSTNEPENSDFTENKPPKPLEDPAFLHALGQAANNVFNLLEEQHALPANSSQKKFNREESLSESSA